MFLHLQDFIICIEMFLAAIAHHYTFTYKPYVQVKICLLSHLEVTIKHSWYRHVHTVHNRQMQCEVVHIHKRAGLLKHTVCKHKEGMPLLT